MAKKKVVYKIIHSNTRRSYSMTEYNRYCIIYHVNTIVKAIKGSVGIMCFETKEYAEKFVKIQYIWPSGDVDIIDVHPIGKAKYPKTISAQTIEDSLNIFYEDEAILTMSPPEGTVCYNSVEVLM